MANYSDDTTLVQVAPKIMDYKVTDWTWLHARAKEIIDRTIEQRWYRPEATNRGILYEDDPFDATLLDADQLVWLSCYKVLELAYQYLMKPGPDLDGFERQALYFAAKYDEELQALLSTGLTYDWDADDSFSEDERVVPQRRRLRRA
jgi:hypothetical protein